MVKNLAVALLLAAASVSAVWAQGQSSAAYLAQAFLRVTDSASAAAKLGNFGYHEGISILGAWVNCRESVHFYVPLTKDVPYMFVGGGDNDAQNVDLEIQDVNGKVLASENRVAPDAMVTFTPPADGSYTLKLTLSKSRDDLKCVCVACILKENGHKIPLKSLDECADRMLKLFTDTDKLLQKDNIRLDLHRTKNQWAVYGAVLSQGQNISVTNLDLGTRRCLFLSMGDKNAEDVDLFILDNKNNVVAQDQKTNSEAIVGYTPAVGGRYGIRMVNFKGNGPSVIMTGIFDVIQR